MIHHSSLSRRSLLRGAAAVSAWAHIPRFAHAAGGRDPRFVTIILRGAMDGLSAVAPIGDPLYASLHGDLSLTMSGDKPALALDPFFGLNPAMPVFHRLYQAKQALVVHAVCTPYRERSHFDGQDVLESGYGGPGFARSGWLNRALEILPKGDRITARGGLGVGTTTPLVMRGAAPVLGWAPQTLPAAGDDLAARLVDLYTHSDPALAHALQMGLDTEKLASREMSGERKGPGGDVIAQMRQTAQGAAKLIAADDGPRIAALAFDGWDTHTGEGGPNGRLARLLAGLDGALEAFEAGLGAKWRDTVIVAITEFGRTVRINGTAGTDHGTGTVAFMAGGAVNGGRVLADWPGLGPEQLFEGRDLRATTDLRGILKGIGVDHLGLSPAMLADKIFPASASVSPMRGLIL